MTPYRKRPAAAARRQHGVTMLVVLVLLSAMLLGGMAMARLSEVGTLASGNSAWRDAALQASEVGVNTAFTAVAALADENTDNGTWYKSTVQAKDANGLPSGANWESAPEVVVGTMSVRYVVERACTVAVLTDPLNQCLVKYARSAPCSAQDCEQLDPPTTRQFRITVRVTGPKGTQTFVQSLVNRGTT